jgi:glutamate 5-kinase
MTMDNARQQLRGSRRLVVKIGSKALADEPDLFQRLAEDIRRVLDNDGGKRRQVVLVSSGAIALGTTYLGLKSRPRAIQGLQAAAAAGQSLLMQRYGEAFANVDLKVAQVLLTHADLARRQRANNARAALTRLLELGVVPIINENDAVAVDEIRFGDNDELAAMVAPLTDADLLVLLSDVAGLLDDRGQRIHQIDSVDERIQSFVTDATSAVGRGGMRSKLESARRATLGGTHVVIAPATLANVVSQVVLGQDVGTLLPAQRARLTGRKQWIAYTLRPRGAAVLDDGAARAMLDGGRSVLCVGVMGVRGDFVGGDPISLLGADGRELARGLSKLSAAEAARLAGSKAEDDDGILVHRDDLVVLSAT